MQEQYVTVGREKFRTSSHFVHMLNYGQIKHTKASDCVVSTNWKIFQEMGIPDHLTCLLRNLYTGQEATVRTGYGTIDWFQIGKGVHQGCKLPPCLFNLHAEYTIRNAGLDEAQAGIKIARRNIDNLRYADDTTMMADIKELKSLLRKVKEESENVDLQLSIQKAETPILWPSNVKNWLIGKYQFWASLKAGGEGDGRG